jgi:hypothetical protein
LLSNTGHAKGCCQMGFTGTRPINEDHVVRVFRK